MKIKNVFKVGLARRLILLGSILMIIAGIYRGEFAVVLSKAIHICLECIGIG